MLAGAALIFALVMALVVLAFRRHRATSGSVRIWIVGLGLVFPMAVLAALLAYGLIVGADLLPRGGAETVRAEASRQAWTFRYDAAPGRTTLGVLHIPAGRPVDVAITSSDVIHSFWVPRLAGKLDAIPGRVNVLRIEADAPGRFHGLSAEFSGGGYLGLTFSVTAHDTAAWDRFVGGADE